MIGPIVRLSGQEKQDMGQPARQLHNAVFMLQEHIRDDSAKQLILDDLKDVELALGRARRALGVSSQKKEKAGRR